MNIHLPPVLMLTRGTGLCRTAALPFKPYMVKEDPRHGANPVSSPHPLLPPPKKKKHQTNESLEGLAGRGGHRAASDLRFWARSEVRGGKRPSQWGGWRFFLAVVVKAKGLVAFGGDWEVHWGYGILTHGHIQVSSSDKHLNQQFRPAMQETKPGSPITWLKVY